MWYAAVLQHRQMDKHAAGTCVVLAHVIDERRERQVTRREASAWCELNGLPFFETHPADIRGWRRLLVHLTDKCRPELAGAAAFGDRSPPAFGDRSPPAFGDRLPPTQAASAGLKSLAAFQVAQGL